MHSNGFMLGKTFSQIPNHSIPKFSGLSQLGGNGSHDFPISDWRDHPRVGYLRDLIRNKIAQDFQWKTSDGWGQPPSDLVSLLENQLFMEAFSEEEYVNQETLNYRLQVLIQRKIDAVNTSQQVANYPSFSLPSTCMTMPTFGLTNDCNSDKSALLFNHFNDVSTENGAVIADNSDKFGFLTGLLSNGYKQGVASNVNFDGENMPSSLCMGQVASEMVYSPEQTSTITTLSSGDGCSDVGSFDSGPVFSQADLPCSSEKSFTGHFQWQHLDHGELNLMESKGCVGDNHNIHSMVIPSTLEEKLEFSYSKLQIPQNVPHTIPEASNILPSMDYRTLSLTLENLLQSQSQNIESQQNEQPLHQPSVQFNQLSEAEALCPFIEQTKFRNPMGGQFACKQPNLPSEQSQGVQVASESSALFNSSKKTVRNENSSELLWFSIEHKMLLTYLKHKSSGVPSGENHVSFVNSLHQKACNDSMCRCQHFCLLLSHFDDCQYADCNICGPVRHLVVTGKIQQKFKNAKNGLVRNFNDRDSGGHSSGSSENMQPPSKRLRLEYPFYPFSSENRVLAPLKVQPCEPGRLPSLQRQPESPVCMNSEVNMTLSANSMKDYAGISVIGNDFLNNYSRLNAESVPTTEEVIVSREEEETNLRSVSESADSVKDDSKPLLPDNFPRLNAASVLTSEEPIVGREEEDMDLKSVGESAENVKVDSECLLPDNFPRLNAESVPTPEKYTVSCEGEEVDLRSISESAKNLKNDSKRLRFTTAAMLPEELGAGCKEQVQISTKLDLAKPDTENEFIVPKADCAKELKSETPNISGVSLTEFFTAEQLKELISSLRPPIDQSIAKEEKGNKMTPTVSENSCQLCAGDKLSLAPTPIYCSSCGARIKRSVIYYSTLEENGMRHCFCTSCYKESRGGSITFYGIAISKAKLDKKKNDEETEESWVQCDKCQGWQHQICALFNDKRDMEGKAEYVCPKCCLKEIESGERVPLSRSAVFSAKDLPSTMLSNHIEQRLYRRLWQEREDKAKVAGKNFDEVPGAEDLVVRVVLSVDRQLKVKQQLLDIFHDENYPAEFPYRSKVILLFQKIEGVDVCLFGMYVQEFGSECGHPNQRCVYISYLDSVKYFRPETETAAGETLRTFVYHEILIGYLEYCKKRGFATCYLWACPPLKGEDYILYCHPENQKTPKSDKLRHWYHSMLRKAAKEKIVVNYTNLYDHFFVPTGQCYSKVTAARLPYFDGDYWSGAAENVIKNIEKETGEDSQRKGKNVSKRTFKSMGHTNPSDGATKDVLLMQKLGQTILPVKEDFIIVHLQFVCTHCHQVILSGWRWFCSQCKNFYLCERCHDVEQNRNGGNTHTLNSREKHLLSKVMVDVPSDTEDKDVILDIGLFENRHAFLGFCQKNHYQFDTLRRAKHSSMMILHHLRNPTVLTSGTTCSICRKDTLIDQCWLCDICPKFDVCSACYHKEGGSLHVHKLTPRSPAAINGAASKAAQRRASLTRDLLDVIQHASQCQATKNHPCSYPNCLLLKRLFCHTSKCTLRMNGGCEQCKKAWQALTLHSRICRESDCGVPRCKDLKKARLRAQQSENH